MFAENQLNSSLPRTSSGSLPNKIHNPNIPAWRTQEGEAGHRILNASCQTPPVLFDPQKSCRCTDASVGNLADVFQCSSQVKDATQRSDQNHPRSQANTTATQHADALLEEVLDVCGLAGVLCKCMAHGYKEFLNSR